MRTLCLLFWRPVLAVAVLLTTALPAPAQEVAIVNARAWTMGPGGPVEEATILIDNGRILSVRTKGVVPSGVRTIDAAGRHVTPALFAAATQIGLFEVADAADTADETLGTDGMLGPAFAIAPAVNANALALVQARADGVVWAMSFPSGSAIPPFSGQSALLRLVPGGSVLRKRRAALFVRIGGSAAEAAGGSRAASWIRLRAALDEARALAQGEPPQAEDRLFRRIDLAALRPVVEGRMKLALQLHRESDIREAIALAEDQKVRIVLVGAAEAWRVAAELAEADIAVILDPTANLPMSHDEVGARLDNAAILHRAGVTLGVSVATNSVDMTYNVGPSSRTGAGIAVANGLPYEAALRALTLGSARIWDVADETGSLEPGKLADLVIWDGDPLEPGSAPDEVLVGGRPVSLTTRQALLSKRYSPLRKEDGWPPAYD